MSRKLHLTQVSVVLLLIGVFGASCTSPGKKTAVGAGGGAATGATIGGLAGGWKGAAIGGAVGGIAGGAVGNYLDKQAKELEQVAQTKRTKDGILVKLKNDLLFDTGSAVLKENAVNDLVQLGDILAKYKEDRIRIEGYTDNVGSNSTNETLSLNRAEAVKKVLVTRGVQEQQIITLGLGESKPVASNKSIQGRSENRRVELHIDVPQDQQKKVG
jgi:outer membrane protein OmpA-like peptidoglycan-associated protein